MGKFLKQQISKDFYVQKAATIKGKRQDLRKFVCIQERSARNFARTQF
jgi:hypothetical protein